MGVKFMETIYQFFNHPFFVIFGGISATLVIVGVLEAVAQTPSS